MRYVSSAIKALLLICAVIFCVINTAKVDVTFLPWPQQIVYKMPLFLPILVSFFIGSLLMIMVFAAEKFRMGKEIKKMKKQLDESKAELSRMQNISLIDDDSTKNDPELS